MGRITDGSSFAALIPPATFLQVLPHLPTFTLPPIRMRTFAASGLSVLHTPPYGSAAFASRLVGLLTLGEDSQFLLLLRRRTTFNPFSCIRIHAMLLSITSL